MKRAKQPTQFKGNKEVCIELSYEKLLELIYGVRHIGLKAGWTGIAPFRRSLVRLFKTLATAADRNILGDDGHRDAIRQHCEHAAETARHTTTIDALNQHAIGNAIELAFLLLGRLPRNWDKPVAGWQSTVDLSKFRSLVYVRTPTQRVAEMTDHAYRSSDMSAEDSQFTRVITVRRRHPRDDRKVLAWIRANEPALYRRFNRD